MTVTTNATNMELRHTLMEFIEKEGRDNIYKVTIVGYRNPDFDIDLECLAPGRKCSIRNGPNRA